MTVLHVTPQLSVRLEEVEFSAIRSQGAGGQNVNKVSSAIHLRFDVRASSLPEHYQLQILAFRDTRISEQGVIIIKAQRFRTQEKNRADALERLAELLQNATRKVKPRRPTKPSKSAKKKRTDNKVKRGEIKKMRSKVTRFD